MEKTTKHLVYQIVYLNAKLTKMKFHLQIYSNFNQINNLNLQIQSLIALLNNQDVYMMKSHREKICLVMKKIKIKI
jgi:hypothetical protein